MTETCKTTREILLEYREQPHNESVLKMALEGIIEIEDGCLKAKDAESAARHVETCSECQSWFDAFYPKRAAETKRLQQLQSTYCCSAMSLSVRQLDEQTRFKFIMFRGEDPCWCINDDICFARYWPWCGERLPDEPFGQAL